MLFSDALCFVFLTITITTTCVAAEHKTQELDDKKTGRRSIREAIIIAGYPQNNLKLDSPSRVSKLRYWQKKPKRGAQKPMYGPPPSPPSRIPVKKYRKKQLRSKYNKYSSKRQTKLKYPSSPPYYGRPSPRPPMPPQPQPYYAQEPAGFGEPPKGLAQEYVQPPRQSYGEPPVDSYGNPLSQSFPTVFPAMESFNSDPGAFEQQYQSLQSYHQDANIDSNNAYSKHNPIYTKPEPEEYAQVEPHKYNEFKIDSYADVYKQLPSNDYQHVKQRNKHHNLHNIQKNKPWKGKVKANEYGEHEHVVVGGQYAEPPGRLVPNYHHGALKYEGEEMGQDSYVDPELGFSAAISPYVNYKHSNMAFSPQNLNDAFSPFIN